MSKALAFALLGAAIAALTLKRRGSVQAPGGFEIVDPSQGRFPTYPPPRPAQAYLMPSQRDARFGPLTGWEPNSTDQARWADNTLVHRSWSHSGRTFTASLHRDAVDSFDRVLADIERRGLMGLTHTVSSYSPRLVRGGTSLSSHSYGTALDINAAEAPQGAAPTPELVTLAWIFAKHGWWWGGWFQSPALPDPHHFEYIGEDSDLNT